MNSQLLLTFTTEKFLHKTINNIKNIYEFRDDRIFVLRSGDNPKEMFLTYNIVKKHYPIKPERTILIHRKKETNTLYTINAVNTAILEEVGVMDTTHQLNWNKYRNSLLLTDDYGLRIVPTKLDTIMEI